MMRVGQSSRIFYFILFFARTMKKIEISRLCNFKADTTNSKIKFFVPVLFPTNIFLRKSKFFIDFFFVRWLTDC